MAPTPPPTAIRLPSRGSYLLLTSRRSHSAVSVAVGRSYSSPPSILTWSCASRPPQRVSYSTRLSPAPLRSCRRVTPSA
ncbi:Uncharacterised protein [Bordetella pertussis]|nr:Uncharacterised protein [Bordetella pertussis]